MDVVEFLRARLDEEEATAKAAAVNSETWRFDASLACPAIVAHGSERWESALGSGVWECDDPHDDCEETRREARAEAEHIVYWDPERILADVAAKRAVLRACSVPDPHDPDDVDGCPECTVLYALVQPYRSHPDFDPEWWM